MTATETAYYNTADRIRAIWDQFPDGIDPDFDCGLDDLYHELGVLRAAIDRNPQ
jgi:hypothetical protein